MPSLLMGYLVNPSACTPEGCSSHILSVDLISAITWFYTLSEVRGNNWPLFLLSVWFSRKKALYPCLCGYAQISSHPVIFGKHCRIVSVLQLSLWCHPGCCVLLPPGLCELSISSSTGGEFKSKHLARYKK